MAEARRPNRIDVHHHFYPPEYLAVMGDVAKRRVVRDWTVARSFEEMDDNDLVALTTGASSSRRGANATTGTNGQRIRGNVAGDSSSALRTLRLGADAGRRRYPRRDCVRPRQAWGGGHSVDDELWRALSRSSRLRARHGRTEPT